MKKALLIAALLSLCGCSSSYREETQEFKLPPELSDCRIYQISHGLSGLHVVRCPNSETAASWMAGKTRRYSASN